MVEPAEVDAMIARLVDHTHRDEYLQAISPPGFERPNHQISRSYSDGVFGEAVVGCRASAVIVGGARTQGGLREPANIPRL